MNIDTWKNAHCTQPLKLSIKALRYYYVSGRMNTMKRNKNVELDINSREIIFIVGGVKSWYFNS